ncbi:dynein heavy chain, partial [Toxoplasma gondii FOU]
MCILFCCSSACSSLSCSPIFSLHIPVYRFPLWICMSKSFFFSSPYMYTQMRRSLLVICTSFCYSCSPLFSLSPVLSLSLLLCPISAPRVSFALLFSSKEGESVPFSTTIPILQYASLKDWLAAVEQQMVVTLAENLASAIAKLEQVNMPKLLAAKEETNAEASTHPFLHWVASYPLQALLLALQVSWTRSVETALAQEATGEAESHPLATGVLDYTCKLLEFLADRVVTDVGVTVRQRMVQIITELVHQRDVCRTLIDQGVVTKDDFRWLQYMRFYFSPPAANALPQDSLRIAMADATLSYGFEYLGMAERLIQTPLTDKCFLTLTQALNMKLGGNPFGPAGTCQTCSKTN